MIVALDLSLTATGFATSDGKSGVLNPPSVGKGKDKKSIDGMPRLKWILDSVWTLTEGAQLVVIEGYAFDRPNQAHQIGELGGIIRFTLWESGRAYVEIAPASMKKFATGSGNASKDQVLVEAVRKLGYDGSSKDEADALWLLTMARAHYGAGGTNEKQREALKAIAWPAISYSSTTSEAVKQETLTLAGV